MLPVQKVVPPIDSDINKPPTARTDGLEDIQEEKSAEDQETFLQKSKLSPLETPNRSDNGKRIIFPTILSESDPEDQVNED